MSGFNPRNPTKYQGTDQFLIPFVSRNREPTGADYRQPETGRLYVLGCVWQVGKNPTTGLEGDLWSLSKIVANVAYWVKISSGSNGPVIEVEVDAATAPGVNPVTADVSGLMTVSGSIVANQSIPIRSHTTALNQYDVEVQYATSSGSSDPDLAGLASFNSSHFNVDVDGFVSLAGGDAAIDAINVDANTAPGTDPVTSDVNGEITVTGGQVAAGTTANVIRTNSVAANSYTVEVQRSSAQASSTVGSNGVSHYNSAHFSVDSNGFVSSLNSFPNVGVINLGMNYNAGTFTVRGAASSLSATNIAYVTLQSKTAGNIVTIPITADQTFIDDVGASTIIGNLFGLTSGVVAASDIPFFLYAVVNDAENAVSFMISRIPHADVSPVAGKIGKTGSAVASTQGSFFALGNPTVTDYDSNPCLLVGAFRMQMSTANDWTVQTLTAVDGIGNFLESMTFVVPKGHFGAAPNSFFLNNGGTAPVPGAMGYDYTILPTGRVLSQTATNDIVTSGVGAVGLKMALPFTVVNGGNIGQAFIIDGVNTYICLIDVFQGTSSTLSMYYQQIPGSAVVLNTRINIGGTLSGMYNYQADLV